jgi:hypothetical protein
LSRHRAGERGELRLGRVNLETGETGQEMLLNKRQPPYKADNTTSSLFRVINRKGMPGTRIFS